MFGNITRLSSMNLGSPLKPIEARSVMIDDIGDALELMMNNKNPLQKKISVRKKEKPSKKPLVKN